MRYRILKQLQKPHERVTVEIDAPSPPGTGIDVRGGLSGRVELTNTGGSVLARGNVGGEAALTCARCLKEFSWRFRIEFTENCALRQIDDLSGYGADDDLVPILDEETIDLSELVRQLVVVEAPLQPLCRGDCGGLCPQCGGAVDDGACRCRETPVDPRWAGLRDLLDE
jgi:uncharacterized protein